MTHNRTTTDNTLLCIRHKPTTRAQATANVVDIDFIFRGSKNINIDWVCSASVARRHTNATLQLNVGNVAGVHLGNVTCVGVILLQHGFDDGERRTLRLGQSLHVFVVGGIIRDNGIRHLDDLLIQSLLLVSLVALAQFCKDGYIRIYEQNCDLRLCSERYVNGREHAREFRGCENQNLALKIHGTKVLTLVQIH